MSPAVVLIEISQPPTFSEYLETYDVGGPIRKEGTSVRGTIWNAGGVKFEVDSENGITITSLGPVEDLPVIIRNLVGLYEQEVAKWKNAEKVVIHVTYRYGTLL